MSKTKRVWAYAPIPELKNQTGWVDVAPVLAATLIAQGRVQDPAVLSPYQLNYIGAVVPPDPPEPPAPEGLAAPMAARMSLEPEAPAAAPTRRTRSTKVAA